MNKSNSKSTKNSGSLKNQSDGLGVGKVSKRAGVAISTLHYYEQEGLISSWRNNGNQRRYGISVLRRIAVIKTAQKLGIPLKEIKAAMASLPDNRTPNKSDWSKLSKKWRASLQARIDQLETLKTELDACIGCGCLSFNRCKLYNQDDQAGKRGSGPVFWQEVD